MSAHVLVGYATRYGSTRQVAEVVAATLREKGLSVDLTPMKEVRSLDGYDAAVLGAPLYIGHWPKDVQRFLSLHRQGLSQRPVALFTLGPTQMGGWEGAQAQLDQELAQYTWLIPAASSLFGGKYEPSRLGFLHKLLASLPASPLHGLPASDVRDWTAIRGWASGLAATLQPAQ